MEEILGAWKNKVGNDYLGYKNHVYRMIDFCFALHDCDGEEREKIIVADCLHDLGIWVNSTVDCLLPSIALAKAYLKQYEMMIDKKQDVDERENTANSWKSQHNCYGLATILFLRSLVFLSIKGIVSQRSAK